MNPLWLRWRGQLLSALAALAALAAAAGPAAPSAAAASRSVPQGFLGVMADGPLLSTSRPLDSELGLMVSSGVESIRIALHWNEMQPFRQVSDIPPSLRSRYDASEPVPTRWGPTDRIVGAAAQRGLTVLPVVVFAPIWARQDKKIEASPPLGTANYASFLESLVGRYGPGGKFWTAHPELIPVPIRAWQIWNEPDLNEYWYSKRRFAPEYVRLLRAARFAIKAHDPGALIVAAGLINNSWIDLESIYKAGGRGAFDAAAVHPYTRHVIDWYRLVSRSRTIMNRYGDSRIPLWITEFTWAAPTRSGVPSLGFEVPPNRQASSLRNAMVLLKRYRVKLNIGAAYWYTWLSTGHGAKSVFDYTGLRRLSRGKAVSVPALSAFRQGALALEGCRKRSRANSCG